MPKSHQIPSNPRIGNRPHVTKILNFINSRIPKNKNHLRISNDPPFFSISICGIKFPVILSLSIPEISDKIESLLIRLSREVWFIQTFFYAFTTFFPPCTLRALELTPGQPFPGVSLKRVPRDFLKYYLLTISIILPIPSIPTT